MQLSFIYRNHDGKKEDDTEFADFVWGEQGNPMVDQA
jgi:hypothetical protein